MTKRLFFANALLPLLVALLALAGATPAEAGALRAGALKLLWEIGKADNNTAEFARAPNGFAGFEADPVFIVGASDPKSEWPYVHPGPSEFSRSPSPSSGLREGQIKTRRRDFRRTGHRPSTPARPGLPHGAAAQHTVGRLREIPPGGRAR